MRLPNITVVHQYAVRDRGRSLRQQRWKNRAPRQGVRHPAVHLQPEPDSAEEGGRALQPD